MRTDPDSPAVSTGAAGTPRVSVVVPAHNAEASIGETLDSILAQTYPRWEAIVVDDGSTDATYELASAYARRDPRIRPLRLARKSGPSVARNHAAARSRAELLALLDSDDWWLPHYLERQLALYDSETSSGRRIGIVACDMLIARPIEIEPESTYERYGFVDPITYRAMLRRNYVCVAAVIPRHAFEEVGGFSPDCAYAMDYDLWLRVMEAGYEVAQNREPLAVYRHHSGGRSRDQLAMAEARMVVYRRALARGGVSAAERRGLRASIRHNRALRQRELVRRAWRDGRPAAAAARALVAAPLGLVAFLQAPSNWGEWLRIRRR
jgi:glycosyltransferase involved in cell wall biosynthesis